LGPKRFKSTLETFTVKFFQGVISGKNKKFSFSKQLDIFSINWLYSIIFGMVLRIVWKNSPELGKLVWSRK